MSEPIRVLIIEDSPAVVRLIGDVLAHAEASNFFLESVSRLSDGLSRLEAGGVTLVLLDLTLPDSEGMATFLETYRRAPDTPIIVVTGHEDETLALKALREGAQDYLLKNELQPRTLIRAMQYGIERKRGEEARARLAAIVESSNDAIIGLSLEGVIVSWNASAEAMFGHGFEEVIGRTSAVLAPPAAPNDMPAILDQLKRGEIVKNFETIFLTKDGAQVHVAVSVSPIKNSFAKVIGASMIARNIDERKQAEAERERLITELQEALLQVKTLRGLLPICSCCKKIRDDQGYWTAVEVYVMAHSQAEFTHGICPDCEREYRSHMGKDEPAA
jgi:PAS domain S-box-containing protein